MHACLFLINFYFKLHVIVHTYTSHAAPSVSRMSSSSSGMKGKDFAFDFDILVSENESLASRMTRAINLRFSSKHVLLLSPNLDDEDIKLNWDEGRKMAVAPGALPTNQVVAFCWHKTEAKWLINYPNFEGKSLSYQMFLAKQDTKEDNIVLRQYCDPPRVNKTDHECFLLVGWTKSLLGLSGEDGGVSKEHR
jgi:hypothetical protein